MLGRMVGPLVQPVIARLLRLRVWLTERLRPSETYVTATWAALIGVLGGISGLAFRSVVDWVQWILTGHSETLADVASKLEPWHRVAVPAVGGLLAGLVLHYGSRLTKNRRAADYMEAVTLGDGVIRSQPTLVSIVSSVFSIASGGSIGREGPMVQLSAMMASLVGRATEFPKPRLRLMVACGAAAGIASAYNAPIGGALFVAEIVLGSIAMESFGPLILSSVMATVTAQTLLGGGPLFEVPTFSLVTPWELIPYFVLGLVAGGAAPLFLRMLELSKSAFARFEAPIHLKLMLGGLIVGVLSLERPDVWGNGHRAISSILHWDWTWTTLVALLVFKLAATASTVGSGAVGGVFTPTLFVGAVIGSLIGIPVHGLAPEITAPSDAYALVGMGAFLAATTHAPLMAILMLFEMTLDYDIVLPLMLACVTAYNTSYAIRKDSIYAHALKRHAARTGRPIEDVRVRDLMKPDPPSILDVAPFSDVVARFASHAHHNLYVVGESHQFRGVIPLHEIKPFLNDQVLSRVLIAQDLTRDEFPWVTPDSTLFEALERFSGHSGERLPVLDDRTARRLVGSLSKSDVLLTLAHEVRSDGKA